MHFTRILPMMLVPLILIKGCMIIDHLPKKDAARETFVILDTTSEGVTEATAQRYIAGIAPRIVDAGVNLTVCALDQRAGVRCAAPFTPSKPSSDARKVRERHHAAMLGEIDRHVNAVLPSLFTNVPRQSPLATAILVVTTNRKGPLDVHIMTDGRELSTVANFERGKLIDQQNWMSQLGRLGFGDGSLRDVHLRFVGVPLLGPSDECPTPARGQAIRALWKGLEQYGATVEFEDKYMVAVFSLLRLPLSMWYRKWRARRHGRRDASDDAPYDPANAIDDLIGKYRPIPDDEDPKVPVAIATVQRTRGIVEQLRKEIHLLEITCARQVCVWIRVVGITLLVLLDWITTGFLAHDYGAKELESVAIGAASTTGLILVAYLAAKAAAEGKNTLWFKVLLAIGTIVVVSISISRTLNAPDAGESLIGAIARAIFFTVAIIGPPAVVEVLVAQIRPALPNLNELRTKKQLLKNAKREGSNALAYLSDKAAARHWWNRMCRTLTASYRSGYIAGGGRPSEATTTPMTTERTLTVNKLEDLREHYVNEQRKNESDGLPSWPAQ